jgi:exosortase
VKLMSVTRSRFLWYGAIYGPLLAIIYFASYKWLVKNDWPREDFNYCYLIPFVVLYLIWEKRDRWLKEVSIPSWSGLLFLLPGILLFLAGELAGEFFSIYISSWLVVTGLLWVHVGWKKLKIMAFPLFVSLFLFPLPYFLNTKLTFNLKLLSSEIGIRIIQLLGMSAYREGNIIDLGFTQLQVVDACSGLRYLIPLFLMGVLMAYLYQAALWQRIIIAFSSIPLSIVTNSLRIALTAVL